MIDISVRDLTKAFEVNKNILDGLTCQVQHGERVGILGRNGTGKTTLFRLMVGELTEAQWNETVNTAWEIDGQIRSAVWTEQYNNFVNAD